MPPKIATDARRAIDYGLLQWALVVVTTHNVVRIKSDTKTIVAQCHNN